MVNILALCELSVPIMLTALPLWPGGRRGCSRKGWMWLCSHKTQTESFPALGLVQDTKGWSSLRMLPGQEAGPAWSSAQMFLIFSSATLIAMSLVIFILLLSGLDNVTLAHSQHGHVREQKML